MKPQLGISYFPNPCPFSPSPPPLTRLPCLTPATVGDVTILAYGLLDPVHVVTDSGIDAGKVSATAFLFAIGHDAGEVDEAIPLRCIRLYGQWAARVAGAGVHVEATRGAQLTRSNGVAMLEEHLLALLLRDHMQHRLALHIAQLVVVLRQTPTGDIHSAAGKLIGCSTSLGGQAHWFHMLQLLPLDRALQTQQRYIMRQVIQLELRMHQLTIDIHLYVRRSALLLAIPARNAIRIRCLIPLTQSGTCQPTIRAHKSLVHTVRCRQEPTLCNERGTADVLLWPILLRGILQQCGPWELQQTRHIATVHPEGEGCAAVRMLWQLIRRTRRRRWHEGQRLVVDTRDEQGKRIPLTRTADLGRKEGESMLIRRETDGRGS